MTTPSKHILIWRSQAALLSYMIIECNDLVQTRLSGTDHMGPIRHTPYTPELHIALDALMVSIETANLALYAALESDNPGQALLDLVPQEPSVDDGPASVITPLPGDVAPNAAPIEQGSAGEAIALMKARETKSRAKPKTKPAAPAVEEDDDPL